MKAISTRYFGPTNTKPARIKASAEGVKSKFYTTDNGHEVVARDFSSTNGWSTNLASGQLPNGDWVHCFIPVEVPLIRETSEVRAQELQRLSQSEAEIFRASRCGSDLGQAVTESLFPRTFTVVSVSSNANSFGYKGVLVLAEDGTGFECLYQAYGTEKVPARGDKIEEAKLPTYCRRELPKIKPDQAAKVIKGIKSN